MNIFQKIDTVLCPCHQDHAAKRLSVALIGLIPTAGVLTFTIHAAILLAGHHSHIAPFLFKYSPIWMLLLILLSKAYGFCWAHRQMCFYCALFSFLIEHQRNFGWGAWRTPLQWFALLYGLFIITAFLTIRARKKP